MTLDPETVGKVHAARTTGAMADLSGRGRLRLTGRDRAPWLQGLVSNDVLSLAEGQGLEAALMNLQGHLLSFLRVFALPDALLIDCPGPTEKRVLTTLDQYLMMEQVEIEDVTESTRLFTLQGPKAWAALAALLGAPLSLPPWGVVETGWGGGTLVIARVTHTGEDGYDLFVPDALAEDALDALLGCMAGVRCVNLDEAALELLRLEAGIPAWGAELSESVVPLEARLDRAISRTKGCYVGQEIIARIDARGQVNNQLVGLDGGTASFAAGLPIRLPGADRALGRVTSAGHSPTLDRMIALGYLRREYAQPGTEVAIGGPEGEIAARVAALPFVPWHFPRPIYGEAVGGEGS
jgi:folate-binding protein YgfZ